MLKSKTDNCRSKSSSGSSVSRFVLMYLRTKIPGEGGEGGGGEKERERVQVEQTGQRWYLSGNWRDEVVTQYPGRRADKKKKKKRKEVTRWEDGVAWRWRSNYRELSEVIDRIAVGKAASRFPLRLLFNNNIMASKGEGRRKKRVRTIESGPRVLIVQSAGQRVDWSWGT